MDCGHFAADRFADMVYIEVYILRPRGLLLLVFQRARNCAVCVHRFETRYGIVIGPRVVMYISHGRRLINESSLAQDEGATYSVSPEDRNRKVCILILQ